MLLVRYFTVSTLAVVAMLATGTVHADSPDVSVSGGSGGIRADSHAPVGVMGDHVHGAGEWMLSYRFMRMSMGDGNRIGTDSVTPERIVTTVRNVHGTPPTVRVVPTSMTTDMHMFGAMYAPTDTVTLMAMTSHLSKEMDHITFAGMRGTTRRGEFTTRASGMGDSKLVALVSLEDSPGSNLHLNVGMSFPTGSIDESDRVLAPTGMRPTLTLPYPMQLGSGTYDFLPGITYYGGMDRWGWGAQYLGTLRIGDNDADYTLGNRHEVTAWASYLWEDAFSTSVRLKGSSLGSIDGMDRRIRAPVQTANPKFQGGKRLDLLFGVNMVAQSGDLRGHRLAFEFGTPIYQKLNGPQLEGDWSAMLGWQYAF